MGLSHWLYFWGSYSCDWCQLFWLPDNKMSGNLSVDGFHVKLVKQRVLESFWHLHDHLQSQQTILNKLDSFGNNKITHFLIKARLDTFICERIILLCALSVKKIIAKYRCARKKIQCGWWCTRYPDHESSVYYFLLAEWISCVTNRI